MGKIINFIVYYLLPLTNETFKNLLIYIFSKVFIGLFATKRLKYGRFDNDFMCYIVHGTILIFNVHISSFFSFEVQKEGV